MCLLSVKPRHFIMAVVVITIIVVVPLLSVHHRGAGGLLRQYEFDLLRYQKGTWSSINVARYI